jgi:ribosome assembly protein 4
MDVDLSDEIIIERSLVQFKNEKGEDVGNQFELPLNINRKKLQILYNAIFNKDDDEPTPYLFYLNEFEIKDSLEEVIKTNFKDDFNSEKVLRITCLPQATYRVESVTRCSSSIAGHSDAILSVAFNNNGTKLASGSGDTTVRFWDVLTQTVHHIGKVHKNWVLVISWSPDGKRLASACKNGEICIWDPETGKQIGRSLRGHSKWVNSLAWEPFHRFV